MRYSDDESQGPVIRDRRRIDPVTGRVRDQGTARKGQPGEAQGGQDPAGQERPAGSAPGPAGGAAAGNPGGAFPDGQAASPAAGAAADTGTAGPDGGRAAGDAAVMLAERTADLQRLQAEYANYRKRVERDRLAVREQALAGMLGQLLPVLDDIGRAREHGELVGGFKQVAEALEAAAAKLGLTPYGQAGDLFDPTLHEALMHSYSPEVAEPTCVSILQPGYKAGERILRPARVAVAEPGEADGSQSAGAQPAGQAVPADTGTAPGAADADDPGSPAARGSDD
jgi:molecular chaperone GrpE